MGDAPHLNHFNLYMLWSFMCVIALTFDFLLVCFVSMGALIPFPLQTGRPRGNLEGTICLRCPGARRRPGSRGNQSQGKKRCASTALARELLSGTVSDSGFYLATSYSGVPLLTPTAGRVLVSL